MQTDPAAARARARPGASAIGCALSLTGVNVEMFLEVGGSGERPRAALVAARVFGPRRGLEALGALQQEPGLRRRKTESKKNPKDCPDIDCTKAHKRSNPNTQTRRWLCTPAPWPPTPTPALYRAGDPPRVRLDIRDCRRHFFIGTTAFFKHTVQHCQLPTHTILLNHHTPPPPYGLRPQRLGRCSILAGFGEGGLAWICEGSKGF